MSPAKIQRTQVFVRLNQIWIFTTSLPKSPQYQISQKSVQLQQRWYMRTGGYDEGNRRFSGICERV